MRITNNYCVYTHDIDGDVFYVGKGRSYRPFEFSRRNSGWIEHVEKNGNRLNVEVLQWFDSEEDAFLFEAMLIRELKPSCNQMLNGFTQTETQKTAASMTHKGKTVSKETRRRISESMKGTAPHNKGCVTSDAQKEKLRAASTARPIQDEEGNIYASAKSASNTLGIPWSTLRAHLRGDLKHARGIKFSYV